MRIAGYDLPEKVEIAQRYLIPKALKNAGLVATPPSLSEASSSGAGPEEAGKETKLLPETETNAAAVLRIPTSPPPAEVLSALRITEGAVHSLVRWYCREAGVRQLAQKLERVARKLALNVVRYQEELESKDKNSDDGSSGSESTWSTLWPFSSSSSSAKSKAGKGLEHRIGDDRWVVDEESLAYYVGKPLHTKDRLYDGAPPPGVVMGLAWTNLGGTSLYIEVRRKRAVHVGVSRVLHRSMSARVCIMTTKCNLF